MLNSLHTLNSGTDAPSLHAKCDNPSVSDFNFMEHWKNLSLENIEGEVWLPIPNYNGIYLVSNFGRVKALKRQTRGGNGSIQRLPEQILSQGINNTGYCAIRRTFFYGDKQTNLVHRIVAHAFIEKLPHHTEVNHISGVKTDNIVSNLEWCTRSENLQHAADVLDINTGTKHFRSKFSKQDVIDIYYSKGTEREIANKYKVSHSVIGFIKRKQSYKTILNGLD